MEKDKIQRLLTEAEQKYKLAYDELQRPATDMAELTTCLSIQSVLFSYLQAYLLFKGKSVTEKESIAELLEKCKAEDSDFKQLTFSSVYCRNQKGEVEEVYCLSPIKTKDCFGAASALREIVRKNIRVTG